MEKGGAWHRARSRAGRFRRLRNSGAPVPAPAADVFIPTKMMSLGTECFDDRSCFGRERLAIDRIMENEMRAILKVSALIAAFFLATWPWPASAQAPPPSEQQRPGFTSGELVSAGQLFFGTISRGLASVIERAVGQWGLPNGYVLGEEAGGAFFGGLRYGEGVLYTKNAGDLKVFWQGPSLGWDFGGDGARTMMLVYSLPATQAIYQRFGGIGGSAYFVGGFGMTALTANDANNNVVLVPIRSAVGLRLGANVGYLKFTPQATWNPF